MTVTAFTVRALVLCVILVNGWTDAPNAIATTIATNWVQSQPVSV